MSRLKLLQSLLRSRKQSQPNPLSRNSWLIVGLGNPGPNYQSNRHNIGQIVCDELAKKFSVSFKSHRTGSMLAEYRLSDGNKILVAKSTGFMNNSGKPVRALLDYFSISPDRLIVIHDELDLEFGDIRTKFDGGHAGHNGLRDITNQCGSGYHRVRFGIGRPPGQQPVADFVLSNFSSAERKDLETLIARAAESVAEVIEANRA